MQLNYTTNDKQDKGISFAAAKYNAANTGTAETPVTPLTDEQYVQLAIGNMLDSWFAQRGQDAEAMVLNAYRGADDATKEAMLVEVSKILSVTVEYK